MVKVFTVEEYLEEIEKNSPYDVIINESQNVNLFTYLSEYKNNNDLMLFCYARCLVKSMGYKKNEAFIIFWN